MDVRNWKEIDSKKNGTEIDAPGAVRTVEVARTQK
jgi:hypothetical protein